ncbi:MAG: TldD/PmbA family protein [Bdellovibrionota bacterium]
MLKKSQIDKIIPILKEESKRALTMKIKGFPKPYYCSFLLRDTNWFNTWASSGSLYKRKSDKSRDVYCDIRVGSYRYDQVSDGGLMDNDKEEHSYDNISMPIDDKDYQGLQIAIWKLMEEKFKEALSDYNLKEAARVLTVDTTREFNSFYKLPSKEHIKYSRAEKIDEKYWINFCKKASKWVSSLSDLTSSYVDFDTNQETKVFVSTEDRVIVEHCQTYSLLVGLIKLTKEGVQLSQELVINTGSQKELPSFEDLKELVLEKHSKLMKLSKAKKIHSFSGPVLLSAKSAGVLFHEAIGHRLEGSRLLATGEGQTFKGQIGKKILDMPITIHDNPKLKYFNGKACIGAYDFDDEGTQAKDAVLIENGVLKDFLSTRGAFKKTDFVPNGHARNKKHQRPISRMAVTLVEAKEGFSFDELKKKLIEEIKRQKKKFGMIVYETSGGETDTSSYDFQAFAGEISYATLIYANGKEETVRGVDFVGTPLQALNNIIAVGNTLHLDNSYCGAESGYVPVTTISPAILLKNLELQTKEEELITQYILKRPV